MSQPRLRNAQCNCDRESGEWKDGDFEVITADRVRFRVPSYLLFWASELFRDAQKFETNSTSKTAFTVTLLDSEIETAVIFEHFLKLITDLSLDDLLMHGRDPNLDDARQCNGLIKFVIKWQCSPTIFRTIRTLLEAKASLSQAHALLVFTAGAVMEDETVCFRAIAFWDASPKLVPSKWPLWVWEHCPFRYAAALARSCSSREGPLAALFTLELDDLADE
ncbi:hypothetical protein CC85DRAFT_298698 [Cutaneotrichosporon oleaginosum]|uniref:BTB domain-containing protein n=1 Tax=Cutaneotrichosporon oleaginosum TaxID=879819 RepID=A0A0J1BEG5_9TREE|nr:uncharacterized protein CC85DRAFT_298698 [Cutaneotrichosporon oleaginosum]KLT46509.1 hypothetical protein CC85DRAFT_298698 [Cutaneotrichosporon oleaginosum]TXT15124.1 hypothetical protein COLE_01317 [Cutaneotrichosporon oleaginosum]